jgi:hypothetical protein
MAQWKESTLFWWSIQGTTMQLLYIESKGGDWKETILYVSIEVVDSDADSIIEWFQEYMPNYWCIPRDVKIEDTKPS